VVVHRKTGTSIQFLPSKKYFKDLDYKDEIIKKRLKELAFLNSGIRINFNNDISGKNVSVLL
jgi:DNA gyrase subunit B